MFALTVLPPFRGRRRADSSHGRSPARTATSRHWQAPCANPVCPRARRRGRAGHAPAATDTVPDRRTHMAVTVERSAGDTAIRPFTVEIPEADIEDLRA